MRAGAAAPVAREGLRRDDRRWPSTSLGNARSSAPRTRASSPARAATSTTSSSSRWPTWPSCAARTPTPTSARSTPRPRRRCPASSPCSSAPTSRTTRCRWPGRPAAAPGIQNNVNTPRILATDSVKWTGEGVAAVVAETPSRRSTRSRRSTSTGSRCRPSSTPRRRSQPGAPQLHENAPNNVVFEWNVGDKAGHRRRRRRRRGRRPPAHRQPAPHPEPDGGPRRHRLVQPGHRRVHDLDVEPDAAHPAAPAGRVRDRHPGAQDPLHQPGRRRRVRHEDLLLRRHGAGACSPARPSAAGRSSGSRAAARTTSARSTAATTSPTSRSPATRDGEVTGLRVKTLANLGGRLSTIGPGIPTTLYGRVLSRLLQDPERLRARSPASTRTRRSSTPTAAPAGPRRRTSSSGRWTCSPTRSGWTAPSSGAGTSSRPTSSRTRTRPASGTAVGGAKIYIDSGNYEPAMDKALATAGYDDLAAKKAEAKARGKLLGHGPLDLHRGLRRRAVEVDRRRRRGLGRRDVGVGQHQGPPDRQGRRHGGHPAAGPGPRDDLRPGRRPRARHPDGGHRRPALGHAGHAVRLRLVRQPDRRRSA